MGSRSTIVLCTALSLTSAFHVIRNRMKEIYTEGSLWKNESGRQLVRKFWDNEAWAAGCFELDACTTFTSIAHHHVGATPPRLYSPRLLIVRRPKSGTAKTVPAVPAAGPGGWHCKSFSIPPSYFSIKRQDWGQVFAIKGGHWWKWAPKAGPHQNYIRQIWIRRVTNQISIAKLASPRPSSRHIMLH